MAEDEQVHLVVEEGEEPKVPNSFRETRKMNVQPLYANNQMPVQRQESNLSLMCKNIKKFLKQFKCW